MSKRAERRHHRRRIESKFRRIIEAWHWCGTEEERTKNIKCTAGRGSIGCGCAMCANPRRKHSIENGQVTRAEIKNEFYFKNWRNEH